MKRALKKRANAVVENTFSDDASVEQMEELDNSKAHRRARTKAAMIGLAISMGATSLLVTRQNDRALAAEPVGSLKAAASSLPAAPENDVNFAPRKISGSGVFSNTSVPDNPQTLDVKTTPDWKGLGSKGQIGTQKSTKLPVPTGVSSQSAVKNISSLKKTLKTAKQQTAAKVSSNNDFAENKITSSATEAGTEVSALDGNINVNAQLKAQQEFAIKHLQEKSNRLRASLVQLRSGETKKTSPVSASSARSLNSVEQSANKIGQGRIQESKTTVAAQQGKTIKRFNPGAIASIPALPGVVTPKTAKPYSVKSGDTLGEIAQSYGTSVAEIAKANNLSDPDKLQINQELVIPKQQDRITNSGAVVAVNPNFIKWKSQHQVGYKASKLASSEVGVDSQSGTGESAYGMGGEATPLVFAEMRLAKAKAASNKNPKYNERIRNLKAEIERLRAKYRAQQSREGGESNTEAVVLSQTNNTSTSNKVTNRNKDVAVPIAVPKPGSATAAVPGESKSVPIAVPQAQPVVPSYNNRPTNSAVTPRTNNLSTPLPPLAAAGRYLPKPIENMQPASNGFAWPTKTGVLTSGYGWRWGRMHRGIDIAAPTGTPIYAAADGVVQKSGWNSGGYGNLVDIRHADGTITRYAHNSKLLVKKGQQVQQGQKISLMGSTGFSTGPHLHFEIRPGGTKAKNPMAFLPPKPKNK